MHSQNNVSVTLHMQQESKAVMQHVLENTCLPNISYFFLLAKEYINKV